MHGKVLHALDMKQRNPAWKFWDLALDYVAEDEIKGTLMVRALNKGTQTQFQTFPYDDIRYLYEDTDSQQLAEGIGARDRRPR